MVRLKDEVVCVKIFANGEKYDVGVGSKQFNSIGDLIAHYKKHPLKTVEGTDIHLDQVGIAAYSSAIIPNFYRELTVMLLHQTSQVGHVLL